MLSHLSEANGPTETDSLILASTNTTTPRPQTYYAPLPTTSSSGESIYGAITKRLTNLEREMSLTLRYIEDQGKIFQDIFNRLEGRLAKTEAAQAKQEQLMRRITLDFELHRAKIEQERVALASQVNLLAEEVTFAYCCFEI